ncbi:hypothetical protein D3C80_522970 [compost metagenome]
MRLRFAKVVTTAVERTAERADRRGIGWTPGHILRLEIMFANRTGDGELILPGPTRLAGEVIFAAGFPCDQRRDDKGYEQRDIGRERRDDSTERTKMGGYGDKGGNGHCSRADRIDVIKMGALELDTGWRQAKTFVDKQICGDRAQPGHGNDGENTERLFQHFVDAELHQEEADADIEYEPHNATGMAVRQPRKEVRPG